ncbi:MAG TPA: type II secretion system F family protein, partial [Blastocatellia bacterium]|nr:type II secretion system F family protein [Blastocatellia bacterium]
SFMSTLILLNVTIMLTFICAGLAAYWWIVRPANPLDDRLREINPRAAEPSTAQPVSKVIVERVAKPISKIAPPSKSTARRLRRRLIKAGFTGDNAVSVYGALRLGSAIFFPIVAFIVALASGHIFDSFSFMLAAIAMIFGLFIPSFILSRLITKRQQKIMRALPDAIDLMVVCVEAGLALNSALQRVGRELEFVEPTLAAEMAMTNREIRAGKPRDEALRNMGDRTGVDDIKSLVAMLIQSDKFGTSIAASLRIFADSMRTKRRQRAEELVSKATIKLIFPLLLFIFPALLIVLLAPALMQLPQLLGIDQ